jgi:hypothetical protein
MSREALVPVNIFATDEVPLGRRPGDLYWNTDVRRLYAFDGVSWIQFIPIADTDIIEGGNEAAGSDTYSAFAEGGDENAGSDAYTSSYDGGGVTV